MSDIGRKIYLALFALMLTLCSTVIAASAEEEDDDDPTANEASVASFEKNDQPLDALAPLSQFIPPDGEDLWNKAVQRVTHPSSDTGGFFDIGAKLGEFVSAKNFHYECTTPDGENSEQLVYVLAADEALKENNKITLKRMRIILYMAQFSSFMEKNEEKSAHKIPRNKSVTNKKNDGQNTPDNTDKKKPNQTPALLKKKKEEIALTMNSSVPIAIRNGRIVITAPQAIIDQITNEGQASGNVTIEFYPQFDPSTKVEEKPIASLSSERLNWRTWGDPTIGSKELAMYTTSKNSSESEPMVTGQYRMIQADGSESNMRIQGRGMVYEIGSMDVPNTVYDENGHEAGLSNVARNRVVFRKDIQLLITGTTLFAPPKPSELSTGNGPSEVVDLGKRKAKKNKKETTPVAPERTIIVCNGPGMIDLACIPKAGNKSNSVSADNVGKETLTASRTEMILPTRRFDFLNGVTLDTGPLENAPIPVGAEPVTPKRMSCKHLRIVYPPGTMPSAETLPDYAEAIGGVNMSGMMMPLKSDSDVNALTAQEPTPYDVSCQRMYFDYAKDNIFMVGAPGSPVSIKSSIADVRAQQFNFRRLTQTLTIPAIGLKRMVMHKSAKLDSQKTDIASKTSAFDSGGETIIEWNGPMYREIKHLPQPGKPDRLIEIFTIKDSVKIEQPSSGLKMLSKEIRIVRTSPEAQVVYIRGKGGVDTTMGSLQATGDRITVDMNYEKNEIIKNTITVIGYRKNEIKATLFMGGTAIRSDKFVIDRIHNTLLSLGGTLAIVKAPPPDTTKQKTAKPDAAEASGALFKGISFQPGGNMLLQCDGDFYLDSADQTLTAKKNVLIRQSELQLLTDDVDIQLKPNKKESTSNASGTPAENLFSGELKSITCNGTVEITNPKQLVQCDQLIHNVDTDSSVLKMTDPDNDVRIYIHEENGSTRFISVKNNLYLDGSSGKFTPGGKLLLLPYRHDKPAPRDKYSSPERKKITSEQPHPDPKTTPEVNP